MKSAATGSSDAAGAHPPAGNKKTRARVQAHARKLKFQAGNSQEVRSLIQPASAIITPSANIRGDVEPDPKSNTVTSMANFQSDMKLVTAESVEPEPDDIAITKRDQTTASRKFRAKQRKSGNPTESSNLNIARDTDAPIEDLTDTYTAAGSSLAPVAVPDTVGQPKPRCANGKGRRGVNRQYKKKKPQSGRTAQTTIQNVTDTTTTDPSPGNNKHLSASNSDAQEVDRTTSPTGYDVANESNPSPAKIPLPSRLSRMAPVVLPRLLDPLKKSVSDVLANDIHHSSSMHPLKTAKDFAKDIPQMTRDLKRVIEKHQRYAIDAASDKPGSEVSESENNSTDFTILKNDHPEPVTSQSVPNTPCDVLTFEEWKQLPPSKRYAPLSHKEKLAILTMEKIPQTFLESSKRHATNQAVEVVSPRRLPMMCRMAFTFARIMALARSEAENGHFIWSTNNDPSTIDSDDVMSRAEVENFVTGMQEVQNPDRGGRVVMRRYWRLVGGLGSDDGVGGVIAACSKEEWYLGRPSFRLKAKDGGVEAVLVCEVEVDEGGLAIGRGWNLEE